MMCANDVWICVHCVRRSDDVAEPSGGFFPAVNLGGSLVAFSLWMELRLHPAGQRPTEFGPFFKALSL